MQLQEFQVRNAAFWPWFQWNNNCDYLKQKPETFTNMNKQNKHELFLFFCLFFYPKLVHLKNYYISMLQSKFKIWQRRIWQHHGKFSFTSLHLMPPICFNPVHWIRCERFLILSCSTSLKDLLVQNYLNKTSGILSFS